MIITAPHWQQPQCFLCLTKALILIPCPCKDPNCSVSYTSVPHIQKTALHLRKRPPEIIFRYNALLCVLMCTHNDTHTNHRRVVVVQFIKQDHYVFRSKQRRRYRRNSKTTAFANFRILILWSFLIIVFQSLIFRGCAKQRFCQSFEWRS